MYSEDKNNGYKGGNNGNDVSEILDSVLNNGGSGGGGGGTDDYLQDDVYDADLARQQGSILDHLQALENQKYNEKFNDKKVVFETDKNFLDKFLIPNKNDGDVDNGFPPKKKTTASQASNKKTSTKAPFKFHGI
jgi:hypothetical protein